jgi:hypothetical protein
MLPGTCPAACSRLTEDKGAGRVGGAVQTTVGVPQPQGWRAKESSVQVSSVKCSVAKGESRARYRFKM